jgi:hypothetical protein
MIPDASEHHDDPLPGSGRYDWDLAAAMLARGSGVENAARVVGCHRTTIWRALRRSEAFRRRVAGLRADYIDESGAALERLREEVVQGLRREVALGNVRVLLWLADRLGIVSPDYLGLGALSTAAEHATVRAAAVPAGAEAAAADPAPPPAADPLRPDPAAAPQDPAGPTPPAVAAAAESAAAPGTDARPPAGAQDPDVADPSRAAEPAPAVATAPAAGRAAVPRDAAATTPRALADEADPTPHRSSTEVKAALAAALAEVQAVLAEARPRHRTGSRPAPRPELPPGPPGATPGVRVADAAPRRNGQSIQPLAAQRPGCARDAGAVHAMR